MTDISAPARVTGGAGFNFEDKVAAFFLASMLTNSHPCGLDFGTVSKIDWQVGGDGWKLDDLLVTSASPKALQFAISIKSNRPVTRSGFPRSFVDLVRAQVYGTGADTSLQIRDNLYCLAVGQLAGSVKQSWHTLLQEALLGDPIRIARRYTEPGGSNTIDRALFRSLATEGKDPNADTARLLQQVRLIHFDFAEHESRDAARSIEMCQRALASGQAEEAIRLWHRLTDIAAERRSHGGTIEFEGLITELRSEYQLKDRVDHSADWAVLDRRSVEVVGSVRDSIGDRVSLIRRQLLSTLSSKVRYGKSVLITGDGGSGKSSVAKRLARFATIFDRFFWLDATALDFDSLADVERNLGIRTPLGDLLSMSTTARSCIVLDGLEVFGQRAMARANVLLQQLGPNPSILGWTIIATTRPQAVESTHSLFTRAGIEPDLVTDEYVKPPTDQECTEILQTCPSLNSPLIRRELRSSLNNLKLLDWLASDSDGFAASEVQSWTGTTEVIAALWSRWVGSDAASATRAGVMKRLGRLDGNGLLRGVGTSELNAAEHHVLPELEDLDLLAVADERVWFRHDTLGDWARLRILIEESPCGNKLAEYARFPRWHDAIRLYGQQLLETDSNSPVRWTNVLASLDGDASNVIVARDMLVEGLFCTPDAHTLLERAWSALIENKGLLLRRMLNRFQHAATIPDPRFISILSADVDKAEFTVHWRFPWWPLWPGVLSSLAAHADDVARLSSIEAAEVCALWLRTIPVGAVGRTEAGTVALSIGREIQAARGEGRRFYNDHADTTVFEAILHAAPEHPDDVVAICLELARRRSDPPKVVARAKAYQERVAKEIAERRAKNPRPKGATLGTSLIHYRGKLRSQFPEGPAERVDDGLQRAVFETQGLVTLASKRPDEAREILLACSLEPPCHVRHDDMMEILEHFGVEDPRNMHPPMFFRGPWLSLLRYDPSLGVDCIVRLVNHATKQWKEQWVPPDAPEKQRAAARMSLTVDGHPTTWMGNMRIYGWHRERFCGSHLLSSALMALERYLHERLDQDEPIDDIVSQILSDGRSVALLAVLVSIAKYRPQFLSGCLQPLLAAWPLYGWDLQLVLDGDTWRIGFFQWARSGEEIFNMVRDWHTMPHRKQTFREQAVALMLSNSDARETFTSIQDEWQAELESSECVDPETLELLIARFDPSNYNLVPREDGALEVMLEWPESLRNRTEESVRRAEAGARLIAFPFECRELIEKREPLSDDDAQRIWDEAQKFATLGTEKEGDDLRVDRQLDAVLGGVAVLLTLAPEWVYANDDQAAWCRDQVTSVFRDPPRRSELEVECSVSTDRWHSFLAHIAIALLANDTSDSDARLLAADVVMSYWYATTGVALTAAHHRRNDLGDDFFRLVNLAVLWSALRTTLPRYQPSEGEIQRFDARFKRLQSAFVARRIPSTMLDWSAIADIACRAQDRSHRMRYPDYEGPTIPRRRTGDTPTIRLSRRNRMVRHGPGFDIEVLRHAFVWLPNPASGDAADVAQSVACLEQLLGVTLRMIPAESEGDHEIEGTPYEYDRWVFGRVATFAAQLESGETARSLWQPILDLGPAAHYWVESFLGAWTVSTLKEATSSAVFFERWRDMIRYAIHSPIWVPSGSVSFRLADLWEHLLGMDIGAPVVAAEVYQAEFARMKGLFGAWADKYLCNAHSLRAFLHLLRQAGARPLLYSAVPWLLRAARDLRAYDWTRDPIADDLAGVLSLAWTWHSESIAIDKKLLADFVELMNILVTQQSRAAMALRDTVARSAGTPQM